MVFTFVLLLGNLKDIVDLLINRGIDFLTLSQFIFLLTPYLLSFSMPLALLAATLLVIGRFSADNELVASRACGISFFELNLPILGVSALFSFASLYVNCWLAPQTKYRFNQKFIEIAKKRPITLLEEGKFIKDFVEKEMI